MARYRVLEGAHAKDGKLYKKGEIVETDADLLKLNRSTPPKYARLDSNTGEEVVHPIKQGRHPETDTDQFKKIETQPVPETDKERKALEQSEKQSEKRSEKMVKPTVKDSKDPQDGYDQLTDADLRQIAEAEEIPLEGNEDKAELIRLLRENS